jgi:hypothetical protein
MQNLIVDDYEKVIIQKLLLTESYLISEQVRTLSPELKEVERLKNKKAIIEGILNKIF